MVGKKADRIAVIDRELCKPEKCQLICQRSCPIVRSGDDCITYEEMEDGKKRISIDELLCVGCGICTKKCPFEAITIVNLPKELDETPVHRYGSNGFVLYRLPFPSKNEIVGLVGPNGVGKTTALRILSGELKPNLGDFDVNPDYAKVIDIFRGTEMQEYMERLERGEIKTAIKSQRVDNLPSVFNGKVSDLLKKVDERGIVDELVKEFDLENILDRDIGNLSGGELQRVAIIACMSKDADIYYFDELTSFLDVFQRINAAKLIRKYCADRSVMVVDHDLATLDFLADRIHIFYGSPGVYGVVSKPRGVRVGINTLLEGYIKEDNIRFRPESIDFLNTTVIDRTSSSETIVEFKDIKKKFDNSFSLEVGSGMVHTKEVLSIMGANAIGKTTFARILAGEIVPDSGKISDSISISYKPQYIKTDFTGTVREMIETVTSITDTYKSEIIFPLGLTRLLEKYVPELSGGELQRLSIAMCLSKDADLYLLDEPSAFLDVEQRLALSKMINRIVEVREKSALVIDHDLLFLGQVGHKGMVFLGKPSVEGRADGIDDMTVAFNKFLEKVGVTFRKDPQTGRPRANKIGSQLDREQKESGSYFTI